MSVVMVICSSSAVFAYNPSNSIEIEPVSRKEIEPLEADGEILFTTDTSPEVEEANERYEVIYDFQFTDMNGNIYKAENVNERKTCNHNYVAGTYRKHLKMKDGSCRMDIYSAKRCTKCESIITETLQYSLTFPKCTH